VSSCLVLGRKRIAFRIFIKAAHRLISENRSGNGDNALKPGAVGSKQVTFMTLTRSEMLYDFS